jgi:hypothetical protein
VEEMINLISTKFPNCCFLLIECQSIKPTFYSLIIQILLTLQSETSCKIGFVTNEQHTMKCSGIVFYRTLEKDYYFKVNQIKIDAHQDSSKIILKDKFAIIQD